jgi:hypothetical protein
MFTSQAQIEYYRAYAVSINVDKTNWSTWEKSNVPITWLTGMNRIKFDSNEPQVIDYSYVRTDFKDEGTHFYFIGSDASLNPVKFYYSIYANGRLYFTLMYNDFSIMYAVVPIDPN